MAKLILVRHGQSAWNHQNLFTGWVDIPLTEQGVSEAVDTGKKICDFPIDIIYTSTLIRAHMTLVHVMLQHRSKKIPTFLHPGQGKLEQWGHIYGKETEKTTIPVYSSWELNERYYGELQGLNKDDMRKKFGAEQVQLWRRSFDTQPPNGESLAMTVARAWPYFQKEILPRLHRGESILVVAHGNSLRGIIMKLDGLTKDEVVKLELPTGESVLYEFEGTKYERILLS